MVLLATLALLLLVACSSGQEGRTDTGADGTDLISPWPPIGATGPPVGPAACTRPGIVTPGLEDVTHSCRVVLLGSTDGAEVTLDEFSVECREGLWYGSLAEPAAGGGAAAVPVRLGRRLTAYILGSGQVAAMSGVVWDAPELISDAPPPPALVGEATSPPDATDGPPSVNSPLTSQPLSDEDVDWGLDIVDVPHLLLVDSVISGLPLSYVAPLLQCLGCSHIAVRNLTLTNLQAPAPQGEGSSTDGGSSAAERPYGAARFAGLLSADLEGVSCSGVQGARDWACILLQAQQPGANISVRASSFVNNTATALGPPARPGSRTSFVARPPAASPEPTGFATDEPLRRMQLEEGVYAESSPPDGTQSSQSIRSKAAGSAGSAGGLDQVPKCVEDLDRGFGALLIVGNSSAYKDGEPVGPDVPSSSVFLDGLVVLDNTGSCGAGLAVVDMVGMMVTVSNSTITGNTATDGDGGGVLVLDNYARAGLGIICESNFSNNSALNGGGAALRAVSITDVRVSDSHLHHNQARSFGGGLYATADDSLDSINVVASSATQNIANSNGGAIYAMSGNGDMLNLRISDGSSLIGNQAGSGGAISVWAAVNLFDVTIDGLTTISENIASDVGGAVHLYAYNSFLHSLSISNRSTFASNRAVKSGGAIYIASEGGSVGSIVISEESRLANNVATASPNTDDADSVGGGAIYVEADAAISSFTIASAAVLVGNSASHGSGGAVFLRSATLSELNITNNSSVSGNVAAGNGGGVYIKVTGDGQASNVSLSRGVVASQNRARNSGGFLYFRSTAENSATISLADRCVVSGNVANHGGGMYATSDNITLLLQGGSALQLNEAVCDISSCSADGGAAHLQARKSIPAIEVTGASIIADNKAGSQGGGIYAYVTGENLERLLIDGRSVVANNVAGLNGGGVYALAKSNIGNVSVAGQSQLLRNIAQKGNGGAIHLLAQSKDITAVAFSNQTVLAANTAGGSGGAVHMQAAGVVNATITGASVCRDNKASGYGGGLYLEAGKEPVASAFAVAGRSLVANNSASSGGAFYISSYARISLIESSVFAENRADQDGGVAALAQLPPLFVMDLCTLTSNTATRGYGGAFSITTVASSDSGAGTCALCTLQGRAAVLVTRSQFTSNRARMDGGALRIAPLETCCVSNITLSVSASELIGNHADGAGGAIAILNPAGSSTSAVLTGLKLRNCTFRRNSAGADAGAFTSAASHGGALMLWFQPRELGLDTSLACRLNADDVTFDSNTCNGGNGGAAMLISCPATLRRCSFLRNQATLSGGAVASLQVGRSAAVTGLAASSTINATDAGAAASRHRALLAAAGASTGPTDAVLHRASSTRLERRRLVAAPERLAASPPLAEASRRVLQSPGVVDGSCVLQYWHAYAYNCTFAYNTAQLEFGGALYFDASENGQAVLEGCGLQGNMAAGQHGGGVFFASAGHCSGVALIGSRAANNIAALASAGAVYMLLGDGAAGSVRDVILQDNRAAITGGACVLDVQSGGDLTVQNVSAAGNNAIAGDGGALQLQVQPGGSASLLNCTLADNTAGASGGAVRVEARCGSQVTLRYSSVLRNTAGASGGAMYVSYGSETLQATGASDASSGLAPVGGSLTSAAGQMRLYPCANRTAAAALSYLTLARNTAGEMGGAVFLARGSAVSMTRIGMDTNSAGVAGGSVAAQNCSYVALTYSSISASQSEGPGGGFYAKGCGRILVENVNVTSSGAGAAGGGFFIAGVTPDFPGQADLLSASAGNASALALPTGGVAYTTAVLHRVNVSFSQAVEAKSGSGTGGCTGASSAVDGDWSQNTRGQGGGLFVSGSAAVAVSQADLAYNNSAAFGSAFASTQRCDAVTTTSANVQVSSFPSALQAWAVSWTFLDLAARQQCWALALSDTVLPMATTTALNVTVNDTNLAGREQALPIWMANLEASALQVRCSPEVRSVVRSIDANGTSSDRATPGQASIRIRDILQNLFKNTMAAANSSSGGAWVSARYKSLLRSLAECMDSAAPTATLQAVARNSYLGLPPTRMGLLPIGLAEAQQQGAQLSLQAGAYFDVAVQLYDSFNQSVTSDVASSTVTLALLPRGAGKCSSSGSNDSRPWTNCTIANVDAGFNKTLTVPVEGGVTVWRRVVSRAWPGNYSLTFTFSGGDTLKVASLEVPIELRPCAVGETLDLSLANTERAPSWTACSACSADTYGLWADSRPSLASSMFDTPQYLQLMNETNQRMLESLASCQACPSNAICPGGAVVAPQPGHWHSAANSTRIHSCPNPAACGSGSIGGPSGFWRSMQADVQSDTSSTLAAGRATRLMACQAAWYASNPPGADVRLAYSKLDGTYVPAFNSTSDYDSPPPLPPMPPPPPPINYRSAAAKVSDICLLWDLPSSDPNSYMQQQCAPGYTGNLCAACVPGFYIDSEFNCKPCPSVAHTIGLGLVSFFCNVVFILFTAITNFAEGFDDDKQTTEASKADASNAKGDFYDVQVAPPTPKLATANKASKVELGDVVKVIVLHLQYLVIVTRLSVDYPGIILRCQAAFSLVTGAENYVVYNPGCALPGQNSAGQAHVQLLAGILTPCAVVLASLFIWTVRYAFRHPPKVSPWTLLREGLASCWKGLPGRLKAFAVRMRQAASCSRRGDWRAAAAAGSSMPTPFRLSAGQGLSRSIAQDACGLTTVYGEIPVLTLGSLGVVSAAATSPRASHDEAPLAPNPFAMAQAPLLTMSALPTVASGATVVEVGDDHLVPAASARTGLLSQASSRLARGNTSAVLRIEGVSSVPTDGTESQPSVAPPPSEDDLRAQRAATATGAVSACMVVDLDAEGVARASVVTATTAPAPSLFSSVHAPSRRGAFTGSDVSFHTSRFAHGEMWQRRAVSPFMSIRFSTLPGTLRRLGSMAVSTLEPHLNRPIEQVDQKLGLMEQLGVVLMAAVFILYPSWAHAALSTFACYRIDDGQGPFGDAQQATWKFGYWVRDMQAKCYDGRHLQLYVPIGVASVLVFCLAPPLTSYVFVRRMGQRLLKEKHVRKVYGFLYKRYKERFIWWETVLQLETLVLVSVEVLGRGLVASYQALLLLAVFTAVAAINISCSPLLSRLLVIMEFLSLATLSLTITLSLYFTVDNSLDPAAETALAVLIIGMNAGLIFFYCFVVARRFMPTSVVAPKAQALLRRLSTARRGPSSWLSSRPSCLPCFPCWRRGSGDDASAGRGVDGSRDAESQQRRSMGQIGPDDSLPRAVITAAGYLNRETTETSLPDTLSGFMSVATAVYTVESGERVEQLRSRGSKASSDQRTESGRSDSPEGLAGEIQNTGADGASSAHVCLQLEEES